MIIDEYGNRKFPELYRGIVHDNRDPLNKGRLKLRVPQVLFDAVTDWSWGSYTAGVETTPLAVGAGVWVKFEGGDPSFPVWSSQFDSSGSVDLIRLNTEYTVDPPIAGTLTWETIASLLAEIELLKGRVDALETP